VTDWRLYTADHRHIDGAGGNWNAARHCRNFRAPRRPAKRKPRLGAGRKCQARPGGSGADPDWVTVVRRRCDGTATAWGQQPKHSDKCEGPPSASDVTIDDVAEPLPGLALKPHHLHLRNRRKVSGGRVDLDARQEATSSRSLRLVACFITFSRVRLSPQACNTCTRVCATAWNLDLPALVRLGHVAGQFAYPYLTRLTMCSPPEKTVSSSSVTNKRSSSSSPRSIPTTRG